MPKWKLLWKQSIHTTIHYMQDASAMYILCQRYIQKRESPWSFHCMYVPILGRNSLCFLIIAGAFSAMVTTISNASCFQESSSPSVTITWTRRRNWAPMSPLSPAPPHCIHVSTTRYITLLPSTSAPQCSQVGSGGTWDSGRQGQWMTSLLRHCLAFVCCAPKPVKCVWRGDVNRTTLPNSDSERPTGMYVNMHVYCKLNYRRIQRMLIEAAIGNRWSWGGRLFGLLLVMTSSDLIC